MSEEIKALLSIDCWSCGTFMTLDERSENDGDCPCCDSEIDLEVYLAKALAGYADRDARIAELELLAAAISADCNDMANERNQFRAELAALKFELEVAKTDELSAAVWAATEIIKHDLWDAQAELAAITAQEPVSAQQRFRHPQKGTPDWSIWQPTQADKARPEWCIDSVGYEVEYRALYAAPVAKQVVMPEPDMFWDAENPEDSFACGEREMFINLADNISMSDGKIIINLMRAARLPSIEASVWVTEDSEGEREVHFEYLNASSQSAKGGE